MHPDFGTYFHGTADALLTSALVRVSGSGSGGGTGWFAGPRGIVITCHHVVAPYDAVTVERHDGQKTTVKRDDWLLNPEFDLALVPTGWDEVCCLPAAAWTNPPAQFVSRGFQGTNLTDAWPLSGLVDGQTSVRYENQRYHVAGYALDSQIDGGCSGAPLLDPVTRCVAGVIVSKVRFGVTGGGVAVPLSTAATWQPLADLLKANDQAVPRFGPLTNAVAADMICAAHIQEALAWFRQSRLYELQTCVPRPALDDALAEFLAADRPIMPIVGYSGVGKSWWLARMSEAKSSDLPCLLLRGLNMDANKRNLADLIASELREQAWYRSRSSDGIEVPTPTALAVATRTASKPLLILVDGLNEATLAPKQIKDSWVPATVAWLRETGARLAFTCRPELWQAINTTFESRLVFVSQRLSQGADAAQKARHDERPTAADIHATDSAAEQQKAAEAEARRRTIEERRIRESGNAVLDFTPAESRQALRLAGLAGQISAQDARHPLFVGLARELAAHGELPPGDRMPLIERYIHHKVGEAADALGRPGHRDAIRASLNQIARWMLAENSQVLPFDPDPSKMQIDRDVLGRLADEHLLLSGAQGYRFKYDQVLEYLQATNIDLTAALDAAHLLEVTIDGRRVQISSAVLGFALRQLQTKKPMDVPRVLRRIVHAIRASASPSPSLLYTALDIIPQLRVEENTADSVEELLVHLIECREDRLRYPAMKIAGECALSAGRKLRILRHAVIHEDDYGWRQKDWQTPEKYWAFRSKFSVPWEMGSQLAALAGADPLAVRDGLIGWLDDNGKLGRKSIPEATVADLAAGCLTHLPLGPVEDVCERLLCHRAPVAFVALLSIVEANPAAISPSLDGWLGDRAQRPHALALLRELSTKALSENSTRHSIQRALPRILRAESVPFAERRDAARVATRTGLCIDDAWQLVQTVFKAQSTGAPQTLWNAIQRGVGRPVSPNELRAEEVAMFAAYRPDDVLTLLRQELESSMKTEAEWNDGRAWRTIVGLQFVALRPQALPGAIDLIRTAVTHAHPAGHSAINLTVEHLLYNLDDSVAGKADVAALAEEILRGGPAALREPIVHFAFGSGWSRAYAQSLRDAAMASDLDPDTIDQIPAALAGPIEIPTPTSFPAAKWKALLAYRVRFGEARSDLCMMREFFMHVSNENDPLIRNLLHFWRSQHPERRSPPVQALLTALDAGADREEAWLHALPRLSEE